MRFKYFTKTLYRRHNIRVKPQSPECETLIVKYIDKLKGPILLTQYVVSPLKKKPCTTTATLHHKIPSHCFPVLIGMTLERNMKRDETDFRIHWPFLRMPLRGSSEYNSDT